MYRSRFQQLGVALITTFAACHALAQRNQSLPAQVNGQVRYAKGGAPVDRALVRLESFGGGIVNEMTDRTGKFRFSGLVPDQYTVTVRASGFREFQQHVDLRTNNSEYVVCQLMADNSAKPEARSSPFGLVNANVPPAAQTEFEKAESAITSDKKEKVQEGITHLEKAVAIYPKFLEAQLRLGTAYMDLQQWQKAEQALRKTLEIDPNAANASFALGEVYLRQKNYDQGEKALQDGLAIEPRSPQAHLALARVYWERVAGVKDEAQWRPPLEKSYREVNQALQLNANLAAAHLLKGNLLFKVRRVEDALHEFEAYLRLDPNGQFAEPTRALAEKIKKALAQQKP